MAFALSLAVAAVPTAALGSTYSNPTPISIPDEGPGLPYPSQITVAGVTGVVVNARATLINFTHTSPDEVEVLLVAPDRRATLLMSDLCANPPPTSGQTLTFDDAAAIGLPTSGPCLSGTYKPSRSPTQFTVFPAPAPPGPQSTTAMAALNGAPASGDWQLFVLDDSSGDVGQIAGGWSLELLTDARCGGRAATLTGTSGSEELVGTAGPDVILGFGGEDKIRGLGGKDRLCGGAGKDTLNGGAAKDTLLGQSAADKLKGGGGNDTCKGGKGRDVEKSC